MQLLLAYAFDSDTDRDTAAARLGRVGAHYGPLWRTPVEHAGDDAGRVGLHMWDGTDTPWRWPSYDRDAELSVATTYLPLGYERVIGDVPPESAAVPLARALGARPYAVLEMTAPYVIGALHRDAERISLHTDAAGLGRLFELRFPGGWVWSNRPVATTLFAGVAAEPDRDGWRTFAAAGWFLGDRSPIARVSVVPGGATVGYDARAGRRLRGRVDALAIWSAESGTDALAPDRIDEVADALRGLARSAGRMVHREIGADLSGGRDSRLVAAAAIAAGLPLTLRTSGAEQGEADTADLLVGALPAGTTDRLVHEVARPVAGGPARPRGLPLDAPLLPNAMGWHRGQEGLRPSTYLSTTAPDGLIGASGITMGGAAGEIAHGHYYPADYEALGGLPYNGRLDIAVRDLLPKVVARTGPSGDARATTVAQLRRTLDKAFTSGLDGARVFDHFYAAERIRRWGTVADRTGNITPLLVPEFVRAAFALTPAQRRDNALHRAVTARLVPQWAGIGYYQRPTGLRRPALAPRIGVAPDRDRITTLVEAEDLWTDAFDPGVVRDMWARLVAGTGTPGDERMMQRVVWMAAYPDYLASVDGRVTPARPAVPRQRTGSAETPRPTAVSRGRRLVAGALRRSAAVIAPR